MKERITYIHGADDAFEPSQLQVQKTALVVKDLKAAREDRLTFDLDELPKETRLLLDQVEDFHLRWSSPVYSSHASPFNSQISPGLHIFLTPKPNTSLDGFCPLTKKAFGKTLKCESVKESFTRRSIVQSEKPEITPLEYHQNLGSLSDFETYMKHVVCGSKHDSCLNRLRVIAKATEIDIDFTDEKKSLIIRAYQDNSPGPSARWSRLDTSSGSVKTEIGALSSQVATEKDHLRLGGYLVVVGEDQNTKPTLIQFPSRHHSLQAWKYTAFFSEPSGLHPKLRIRIKAPYNTLPPTTNPESCSLNTYFTLPSTIFPDKYQLANSLLLTSLNLRSVRSVSGYTDLEAPDYATSRWGSNMLIELEPFPHVSSKTDSEWYAEIPLHLRYLPPTNSSQGISQTEIPWPVVFWACAADGSIGKLNGNPFDRTNLGYDSYFNDRTIFYHLQPDSPSGSQLSTLHVPVLNTQYLGKDASYLELGTCAVVLVGWLWIVWLLFKGWFWASKSHTNTAQKKKI